MTHRAGTVRLYVEDALRAKHSIILAGAQAHYLATVMRRCPGDPVIVFNGRDGEWLAQIDRLGRGAATLLVADAVRPQQPEPGPWLAFAPIKKSPLEMLVTKATELGAERLLPVLTKRTVVGHVHAPRMRQHAIEAAEQCDRLTVPAIADAVALPDFLATWPPQRCLFVLDPDSETRIGDAICRRDADPDAATPGFLVGPEGGWDASELDAFACLPFVTRVSLGPRILRAETAAVAALASWQALAGDW